MSGAADTASPGGAEPEFVRSARHGDVALITIDNPPLNAIGPALSAALAAAVRSADEDPQVTATVLIGAGGNFMAGADIRQLGNGAAPLAVGERASDLIDRSRKPVVAAIDGYALGGGLEIALSAHYRVATPRVQLGLPEINIGVIPGGGGTQRLPRLIGPKAALNAILTGKRYSAVEAKEIGLIDAIVDGDLEAAALAFARDAAARATPVPIRDRDDKLAEDTAEFFAAQRKAVSAKAGNRAAQLKAIDAVEAACTVPFIEGATREQRLFQELVDLPQAKGFRYAFFAEREARKVPGMPKDVVFRPMRSVAIIGAGTMGGGIAMSCVEAGMTVKLMDRDRVAVDRGCRRIADVYGASVKRGRLAQAEADRRVAGIVAVTDYAELADVDVVIEAVFEEAALKRKVFDTLVKVTRPNTMLLSNTSTIDLDLFIGGNPRAADVAGAHFFSPANVMKLLEVVRGTTTSPDMLANTFEFGRRIGKICVVAGNCDGFIANRSRMPFGTEVMMLLEEGAYPEQIDRVMMDFGYPVGPCMVGDIAGLDVGYAVRKLAAQHNPSFRKLPIPDRIVEMGRHGQKTRAGWYRYDEGSRVPLSDPVVHQVIDQVSAEMGIVRRDIGDDDVLHRLLFASINESCRILEEGMAVRASDIDAMWLHGFGFPRHRGGLLFWADTIGAKRVLADIECWHSALGSRWTPASLLREAAASGAPLHEVKGPWKI